MQEDKEKETSENQTLENTKHSTKLYWVLLAFIIVAGVFTSYLLSRKITTLNSQNTALRSQVTSLDTEKARLKKSNIGLAKSLASLKATDESLPKTPTTTTSSSTSSSNNTTAQPTASLVINNVQESDEADMGASSTYAYATLPFQAISVTMKNLSSTDQTYAPSEFQTITSNGELIGSNYPVYEPGAISFWNGSTLAPGGSITEIIPFETADNLVTLVWTPSGSQPIDLPIPAAEPAQ